MEKNHANQRTKTLIANILKLAPHVYSAQELATHPVSTLQRVYAILNGTAIVQNCATPSPVVTNYGDESLPLLSIIGDPSIPAPVFKPAYQTNNNLATNEDEDWLPPVENYQRVRRMRKMEQHTEALQAKIQAAQTEITTLTTEIEQGKADLGTTLANGGSEKKADALQVRREELSRALERTNIKHQTLVQEMPSAERLDAQARLNEIQGEAQALTAKANDARADYLAALKTLSELIEPSFSPAVRMKELKDEASYWSGAFDLPSLTLPDCLQPDPNPMKEFYLRAVALYEQLYRPFSDWGQKLSQLQGERKRARVAEENRRRQAAGISL